MAYLRKKLTEWIPALLAAILFAATLTPDNDAIPVQTWTYEGICRELVGGSTEGRQALVGSLWHAPLPTLAGLPAAALLPRGAATPLVARTTVLLALFGLLYVLLRFCLRTFPRPLAYACWLAFILLLTRLSALTIQPQLTVTLAAAVATLLKLADWCENRRLTDLVKFSFALALLALCGAPLAGWTLLLSLLLIAFAGLDPAMRPRFQGILILGLLPALYALGIWALMSRLILSDACYAWRFLIHGLVAWQGWEQVDIAPVQFGALACCAILGAFAALNRRPRTALLGLAGVVVFLWHLLLQGFGLQWAADTAGALLPLTALLTLLAAVPDATASHGVPSRYIGAAGALLLFFVFCLPPRQPAAPQATQNRQAQRTVLDAIQGYIEERTPYGRVFICSYRGLGLLEGEQRDRFVPCLDLHVNTLRERYPRQNLFLLVPRPEAEAAFECTVWRHADIYAHGVTRALFAGDWGNWRLYEIITAPSAEQLNEWRR